MTESLHPDFHLSSYAFELPEDRIAQRPTGERSASRLLCLDKNSGVIEHARFADIGRYLPERSLLVVNNSRVIPARVFGHRPGSARMEMLLLTPLPLLSPVLFRGDPPTPDPGWMQAEAEALLRPAKKIHPGENIRFGDDFFVQLLEKQDYGRCRIRLVWRGNLLALLTRFGEMPLPPYIKRREADNATCAFQVERRNDAERYQTVYARDDKAGSVAAPTAGLHFTHALRDNLARIGHEWAEVTLYVGYGTFSPVRSRDIREHAMHMEYMEVPESTAAAINHAKREGRPVIAVGTTSARALEGAFAVQHIGNATKGTLSAFAGWTDIFVYPGKEFRVIDGLVTNFHLPESSLLMLVSALAGRSRVMAAYREALAREYRFFSYGDAMLIL